MEKIKIDSKFADQTGDIMIVELGGHVDQSNSFQLQKMFDSILGSNCYKVVVDFGKLTYMSSAGWGIFVGEIKRFRENGGDIKIANMTPDIYDVYQMLEFYHIIDDYVSVDEAAATFEKQDIDLALSAEKFPLIRDPEMGLKKTPPVSGEWQDKTEILDLNMPDQDQFVTPSAGKNRDTQLEFVPGGSRSTVISERTGTQFIPPGLTHDIKLDRLPLAEKVKKVISQNPLVGVFGIRRVLQHEHFGYTKVGIIKLWRLLKQLDLETKEKRYRYYRSC